MRDIYGSLAGGINYIGAFADGKIGCCCGCCFYPASQFGILYFASDLPSTVYAFTGDPSTFLTLSGSSYTATAHGYDWLVQIEEGQWAYSYGVTGEARFGTDYSPCLFGLYTPGDLFSSGGIASVFADAYAVNGIDTIIRVAVGTPELCKWQNEEGTWILSYSYGSCKFTLNGVEKSGNQDSPAGTYGAHTVA